MHCRRMSGMSLVGFICLLVVLGLLAVVAMKVFPNVVEYRAIQRTVSAAAQAGPNPRDIREAFDRQRSTAYIDSVSGKDLEISTSGNAVNVHVEYQKIIPLAGPASLLLEFKASNY